MAYFSGHMFHLHHPHAMSIYIIHGHRHFLCSLCLFPEIGDIGGSVESPLISVIPPQINVLMKYIVRLDSSANYSTK